MNNIYTFAEQDEIISPQLVVYPALIRENIRRMIGLAGGPERLCPHLKTHKMAAVTKMLLSEGISKCKCATIAEAEMAADAGMKTIVLAYPLVGPNIARFLALSSAYPDAVFYAIGDDTGAVEALSEKAQAAGQVARLLMDVDMGQHRTGVALDAVVEKYLAWNGLPGIAMSGMHCYDGHRHESDLNERDAEVAKVDPVIDGLKRAIIEAGADCFVTGEVSYHTGLDAVDIGRMYNETPAHWKEFPLADGSIGLIPTWFNPERQPDGSWNVYKNGVKIARMPIGATFFDGTYIPYPEEIPEDLSRCSLEESHSFSEALLEVQKAVHCLAGDF